jgi:methyl-accepting chemotaxis protein
MKKLNFFLAPYANEPMEVRRKTTGLFVGSIILTVLTLGSIAPLFLLEVTPGTVLTIVVLIIATLLIGLSLAFLRMKRVDAAIYLLVNAGPVAIFFIYFGSTPSPLELGRLSMCYCVVLALISLIAFKRAQLILYYAESVIAILVFTAVKLRLGAWEMSPVLVKEIIYDILLFSVVFGFLVVAFAIIEDRMRMSAEELGKERERVEKIDGLFKSSKDGIEIGGSLIAKSKEARSLVDEIKDRVEAIFKRIEGLSARIDDFTGAIAETVGVMGAIRKMNEDYSSVVVESSSAVEEISASINNISAVSASKQGTMAELVKSSEAVQQEMENALRAIQGIAAHSDALLEIVDVINGVASRTNLLAMNAAIEAAHAGDTGRGFSVVADEIRRLSEETNENIKIIAETLKKSVADAAEAIGITENAGRYFSRTREDIRGLERALAEVIGGVTELSVGTGEITNGTSMVTNLSAEITGKIREAERRIGESQEGLKGIREAAREITDMMRTIKENAARISVEVADIDAMGRANKEQIAELGDAVDALRGVE